MTVGAMWAALSVFGIAVIATGIMRRVALHTGLLDHPGDRSSHTQPTPRGGGLAIVIAFFTALLWLLLAGELDHRVAVDVALGGLAVAGIGFIDDRYSVPARLRLLVHLAAATAVVAVIGAVTFRVGSLAPWEIWLARAFTVIAIVWAINLFNFMDGIDGIAGSEALFVAAAGAGLNWYVGGDPGLTAVMACMAAATAGFLMWNWPPASIFMGDVGSGFLGFTFSALALISVQGAALPMEVWPILGGVFFVDATVTLVRRVANGHRWHEAHRMHAYQHLARRWNGHLPVTFAVNTINVLWLLPCAVYTALEPARGPLMMAVALVPLAVACIAVGGGKP